MGAKATLAVDVLRTEGIAFTLHEYAATPGRRPSGEGDRRHGYGLEAAERLGVDPRRIFKTLIVAVDGRLACGVVPVAGELDLKRIATALGGRRAAMAEAAVAERATGYVLGGISPIGQRKRLPTVVDASAAGHPTVLVSAGRRGLQVELAPDALVTVTGARLAPIARE